MLQHDGRGVRAVTVAAGAAAAERVAVDFVDDVDVVVVVDVAGGVDGTALVKGASERGVRGRVGACRGG